MGSFLDFNKGSKDSPLIRQVIEHNERYNTAVERQWARRPWWMKVLFVLGFKKLSYNWQVRQWLISLGAKPHGKEGD